MLGSREPGQSAGEIKTHTDTSLPIRWINSTHAFIMSLG